MSYSTSIWTIKLDFLCLSFQTGCIYLYSPPLPLIQDEEINQLSQRVEKLQKQLMEKEELIIVSRLDYESLQQKMNGISAENVSAKEENMEIMLVHQLKFQLRLTE